MDLSGTAPPGSEPFAESTDLNAYELVSKIEVNLGQFVSDVLKNKYGETWRYERVPEPITVECAKRRAQDKGRRPEQSYPDLIDFQRIIDKNWPDFVPHFTARGWKDKREALRWIDRANELRRMVAHPFGAHSSGFSFSNDDIVFLEAHARKAVDLWSQGRGET